ncbi:Retrovirus-related Pol polyprotein from transposon RE1 [Abeliophyllum distichum]|uniref:Retrovirus-related Pol polyprotein from transposon RE1 n=1 Tax=Abeliophyllum distichum TaxID=126358 RepID=A0ABD1Q9E5_9LAMI
MEAAEPLPSSLSDTYQTQSDRNNEEDRNELIGDTTKELSHNNKELEPASDNDQQTACSEIRHESKISSQVQHPMITKGKAGIFKPKVYSSKSIEYNLEPKNVAEVMMNKDWSKAIKEEYDALMKNRTSKLVPFLPSYNIVGNKWVCRLKHTSEGSLQRFKARLVAKDCWADVAIKKKGPASLVRVAAHATLREGWQRRSRRCNCCFAAPVTVVLQRHSGAADGVAAGFGDLGSRFWVKATAAARVSNPSLRFFVAVLEQGASSGN